MSAERERPSRLASFVVTLRLPARAVRGDAVDLIEAAVVALAPELPAAHPMHGLDVKSVRVREVE